MELYTKTKNILFLEESLNQDLNIKNPIIVSDMLDFEQIDILFQKYMNCKINPSNFIKLDKNDYLNKNYILKIFSKIEETNDSLISVGSSYSNNVVKILSALTQGWSFATNAFAKKEKDYNLKTYIFPLTLSLDNSSGLFYYFSWGNTYLKNSVLVSPDKVILLPAEIIKNFGKKEWLQDLALSLLSSIDIIPNKYVEKIHKELNNNLANLITEYLENYVLEAKAQNIDFLKYNFLLNSYNIISNVKSPSTNFALALPLVLNKTTSLEEAMFAIFAEKIESDYLFNEPYYNYICKYLIKKKDYELIESAGNLKFLFGWLKRDIFGYKLKEFSIKEIEKNKLIAKVDKTAFEKYPSGFNSERIKYLYDNFLNVE